MNFGPTGIRRNREPNGELGDLRLSKSALERIHREGRAELKRRSFPGMNAAIYSESTWEFHADYAPIFSCLGVPESYVPYLASCAQIFRSKYITTVTVAAARLAGIPWCDMQTYLGNATYLFRIGATLLSNHLKLGKKTT